MLLFRVFECTMAPGPRWNDSSMVPPSYRRANYLLLTPLVMWVLLSLSRCRVLLMVAWIGLAAVVETLVWVL